MLNIPGFSNELQNYNRYTNKSSRAAKPEKTTKSYDVYTPSRQRVSETTGDNSKLHNLTDVELKLLSEKYDVSNMTEEQKNQLLNELKNMGAISERDSGLAKGGFIPYKFPEGGEVVQGIVAGELVDMKLGISFGDKNPLGPDLSENDWLSNFEKISSYCGNKGLMAKTDKDKASYSSGENLYSRLAEILGQIKNYQD